MDLELRLVDFLCSHINKQVSPNDIPNDLRQDPHATDAWLREWKTRGGLILMEDSDGGIPEILNITVKPHIKIIKQQIESAMQTPSGNTVINFQHVGNNSTAIQGNGSSIHQHTQSGVEAEVFLTAFKTLIAQLEAINGNANEKEALLRQIKPIKDEILSPSTDPGRIIRWGKAAKNFLEGAATIDGVLGLVGRLSSAIALWQVTS